MLIKLNNGGKPLPFKVYDVHVVRHATRLDYLVYRSKSEQGNRLYIAKYVPHSRLFWGHPVSREASLEEGLAEVFGSDIPRGCCE